MSMEKYEALHSKVQNTQDGSHDLLKHENAIQTELMGLVQILQVVIR